MRDDPSTHRIFGPLLMALATLLVTGMVICVRMVPGQLHPFQLAFFRNFFGLAALVAWQWGSGPGFLKTSRLRLHLGRGIFNLLAMLAFYSAVLLGFLVFGEVPDRWVWLGGTLIFLSSTYLALKESGSSEVSVP